MKMNFVFEKQLTVQKSISDISDEIRGFTGYKDIDVSNIYKTDEGTWYFRFSLLKYYGRLYSIKIKGKVYSKSENQANIEIRSGSLLDILAIAISLSVMIYALSGFNGELFYYIIKVILLVVTTCIVVYFHKRLTQKSIDEISRLFNSKC